MMKALVNFFQAFPRYFFLLFAVFFAVGFFVFYESFRMYRAEAELIVVSHGSGVSAEGAAATLSYIPSTLSFYDRLREDHGNVSDPWTGSSPADRKLAWNRVIGAVSVPGSGVIRVSVVGGDPLQASALLNSSIETLYGFSGRLYDRNTEVEVRLLEDVIVHSVVTNAWILLLLSAVCAMLAAFLISLLLQNSSNFLKRATLPGIPLFHAQYPPLHLGTRRMEGIRPVGSFPDITQERNPSLSEDSVVSRKSTPSEIPAFPIEEAPQLPDSNGVEESMLSAADPEKTESDESKVFLSGENLSEPIPKDENHELRMNDEPEDIWERPRFASAGRMGVGMRKTEEKNRFQFQEDASGVASDEVRNDAVSEGMTEEVFSEKANQESASEQTRATLDRNETQSDVPGNLVTVSAQDFTWEKFLFQDEESASGKRRETEGSGERESEAKREIVSVSEKSMNHEPTPEELKKRLNQLLRGEL